MEHSNNGSINMKKHIWEGWEVQDFIEALDIDFQYAPKFNSREEVKKWSMENQPYYKKYIKEVVDYFWNKTQEKNNDNYYDTGGNVNDYIDEKVDEFDADETEMRQQYRGYVRDIEYQGFLAIDTSLTPHERLSDYEFDGEEFDRDNLLEVAKMYPQAEYITFHARLMGDSDFGIEDELSPIDDLAMSFDMNKLNQYGNGGNVNDYFAILTEQLESKYGEDSMTNDFYGRFSISKIKNGIEVVTDSEEVFNEIKEDYANDIIFEYPTYYQLEIKDSDENLTKIKRSYPYASWRYNNDDRIVVKTEDLQTFEEIQNDFNDGEILFIFPPMYRIKIGNFEEFTFEEIDSLLRETLEKYNYNYDAGKDNEDYLYEQSKKFEKEDRDILLYAIIKDKWRLPIEKRESVELKLLNRRNRKGNNDYKGDINNNGITYYNVGIDEGEDIGTRTLEFFDTKAEAQAFMNKFLLSNPNAKLFIDVEKRQPILDKKVIGQQGNVIVNPQEVSSVVEDKIEDFIDYSLRNDFDEFHERFYSTLRDYIDEVFNDSPTEVESIEEIDFEDEIENFIIYFTSDEEKREQLRNLMLDYLDDDNDTNEEISGDNPRNEVTTGVFDNEDEINNIINTLKIMEVDGEKMQYILEQVGMEYQMLSQLIKTFSVEEVKNLLEERIDLDDDNEYKRGGEVGEFATGGNVELTNEKYLNSIPLDKKTRILQNIADHYGISEEQAYAEITDIESEALYEYITDQNLKMHVYQMMK